MNDERMPINIYKLDAGYNDKGMNSNELIKDYKRNIHKWYFIAAVDIVFALIIAFVNFKVPDWRIFFAFTTTSFSFNDFMIESRGSDTSWACVFIANNKSTRILSIYLKTP